MTEFIENVENSPSTAAPTRLCRPPMNISRPLVCMTESWVSLACFLERNEPVTQPKAAHSTSRMPHPESVPEAV